MPRLSGIQKHVREELKLSAAAALPPGALAERLMTSLEKAIGWDGYRLFGVDSRTLLINRLLAASDNDGWARREWLQEVYLDDQALPYIHLPLILKSGLRGVAYQEQQKTSWGYPAAMLEPVSPEAHWNYFHESRSPTGGVLLAGFGDNGRWVAALQAYRRDPGRLFKPGDVDFLRRSGTIIGPAISHALARERVSSERHAGDTAASRASGVVVVDERGEIAFATPSGQEWLEAIGAAERVGAELLPTPLWSAMVGLRRMENARGSHVVRTMTHVGLVTIEATHGGIDGTVAMIINKPSPSAVPGIPDEWRLTEQQRQIALHIVAGKSNRSIAASLFLTENTVEWHVRQIFSRLEVRSRGELTARYFRESAIAMYQDPDMV